MIHIKQETPLSTTAPSVLPPSPEAYPVFSGYGIELEYMLVDQESLDIRPMADELLRAATGQYLAEAERGEMGWSNELALHVVEIKNRRPQPQWDHLAEAFQAEVRAVNELLQAFGARLMPGGMHPWMDPDSQARLWHREPAEIYRTYDRIFDCRSHGWVNVQSMHLNLPFANDLEFARLHAAIRLVLPILPALAASSPFADGRPSGFMDYRLEVYRSHQMRIPSTMGEIIPENAASRADYEARVLEPMYRDMAFQDPEGVLCHEWLNARAAIPRFERSAIEIRLMDVQECPLADLAIAAAVVALIRRFYEAGAAWLAKEGRMATPALGRLLFACLREAEQAVVDDLDYLAILGLERRPCQAREIWARLLNDLAGSGELPSQCLVPLRIILEHGPLARRIVDAVGSDRARLPVVYRELCQCLQDGRMFLG